MDPEDELGLFVDLWSALHTLKARLKAFADLKREQQREGSPDLLEFVRRLEDRMEVIRDRLPILRRFNTYPDQLLLTYYPDAAAEACAEWLRLRTRWMTFMVRGRRFQTEAAKIVKTFVEYPAFRSIWSGAQDAL